jgi:rod shape-determining protein MreC
VHDSRRTRLVLGALLVAALALITLDARGGGGPVGALRSFGGTVFGGAQNVIGAVTRPVTSFFSNVSGAPANQARISSLQAEVTRLRVELSEARLSKAQSAQLQQLLALAGRGRYRIVAANVIAAAPGFAGAVTVDAGRADGIRPNQTVLNGSGLVGTVTSASAHTATVLLTTDATATVGVQVAGTGQLGAVTGTGPGRAGGPMLRLQVFDASAILRVGEQLVTFGSVHGQPYVPGVPVGVITQVLASGSTLTKAALVRPYASASALGVVGVVVVPPRVNPRFSVLPPRPTASLTPHPRRARRVPGPAATPTTRR